MGKRILVQRRGRGSRQFRAPSHKRKGEAKHLLTKKGEAISGVVMELLHDPGRGAPLARVKFENGIEQLIIASEGIAVGQTILYGPNVPITPGNSLPLEYIPEGTPVFNVERTPLDGGKLVRSSGTYATLISRAQDKVIIKLPSGAMKPFDPACRATIGVVAGGGRPEKPLLKAGKKHHMARSKGWKYPTVRGVAMIAASHPHGGGAKQGPGKSYTVSRNAPPGAKVGLIAAKRTGRRKRK